MTSIEVNGVRLACDVEGSGPPLLMLHGFTGSAGTWSELLPTVRERHRVMSPDLLGHGRSEAVREPQRYRLDRQADDLAALLSALGVSSADILGYSMGARIALRLAVDHPERVDRLVLESPSPGIADPVARERRTADDEALAIALDRDGIELFMDAWEQQPLFASHADLPPETRARLRRERTSHDARALAASLRGGGQGAMEPIGAALGRITASSLVIAGALDEAGYRRARHTAEGIPDARFETIDGAGHNPHLERPAAFTALLASFLDTAIAQH
jgi:2-succinyl-6-hydroxy-2,4-cyclohexadiene-1-carboxylate synthase